MSPGYRESFGLANNQPVGTQPGTVRLDDVLRPGYALEKSALEKPLSGELKTTSFVYHEGKWTEGDPPLFTAMSHAVWLSSVVFDGARAFEGVTPDLDLHCERIINSCHAFGMTPMVSKKEMIELATEGVGKFESGTDLYIRSTFWGQEGWIAPDPDSTQFAMLVYASPMPAPTGFGACLSTWRRPKATTMPSSSIQMAMSPSSPHRTSAW